jgi:hypothetical protein
MRNHPPFVQGASTQGFTSVVVNVVVMVSTPP